MHSELASAAKIDGNIPFDEIFHLPNAVIPGRWAIVHEFALGKFFALPGSPVERRNHRKQFKSIWKLEIAHGRLTGAFNETFWIGFTRSRKAFFARWIDAVRLGYSQKRTYFARSLASDPRHFSAAGIRGLPSMKRLRDPLTEPI